jgi:hypothetical protein
MTDIISSELDYSQKLRNHSTIAYKKLVPQSVSSNIQLSSTASNNLAEIIISPAVFNPAKSKLNFQVFCGTGASGTTYFMNALSAGVIGRIVCYDSSNSTVLCDINNLEKYMAMVGPQSTPVDDFMTKGVVALGMTSSSAASQLLVHEDMEKCNIATNNLSSNAVDMCATNAFVGRRQFYTYSASTTLPGVIDFSIPLSAFKFCFLSLDKNLYFTSNIVLQIYFNSSNNFIFQSTGTITGSGGALSSFNPVINNVNLLLATEQNLNIIQSVINRVQTTGITLNCGFPSVIRTGLAASSSQSLQVQLTSGYSPRILAIISAMFSDPTTPSANPTLNNQNSHTRNTLTFLNSYLNQISIKYPTGIDCTKCEDWLLNRVYLKGSATQNLQDYVLSDWIHVDSFVGDRPLSEIDQTETDGLDVRNTPSVWSLQANLSASTVSTWISIVIGQKTLSMTSQGSLMS